MRNKFFPAAWSMEHKRNNDRNDESFYRIRLYTTRCTSSMYYDYPGNIGSVSSWRSRGWSRLTPCSSSKRIPRVVSVSVYFFLSFFLFLFSFFSLHRKGFYREGNPLGLNHSNNTFTSLLSLSIPPFFHASFLVDQMQPIRN